MNQQDELVRNRSEPSSVPKGGRHPNVSAEGLVDLALALRKSLGEWPSIDDLASEGGCQKQRAVNALRAAKDRHAMEGVRQSFHLPPAIDARMRALVGDVFDHCAESFSVREREMSEKLDACQSARNEIAEQLAEQLNQFRALTREVDELRNRVSTLQRENVGLQALAEERKRRLDFFDQMITKRD